AILVNDAEFDEDRFEQHLEADPQLVWAACWYWIHKLQACFYAGDYESAKAAAAKAEPLLERRPYRPIPSRSRPANNEPWSNRRRPACWPIHFTDFLSRRNTFAMTRWRGQRSASTFYKRRSDPAFANHLTVAANAMSGPAEQKIFSGSRESTLT